MNVFASMVDVVRSRGAGYWVLLDPDHIPEKDIGKTAKICERHGADILLVGGSLMFSAAFERILQSVKESVGIPVVLFPGDVRQLSDHADAVLFMSLLSGRNPHYLIGEQVVWAPVVRNLGIEPIPTAYLLVEGGTTTTVEFLSGTKPLPRGKPEIAVAHALAGEYLGMKMVYLECGSGAGSSVPDDMVMAVSRSVSIPVATGGGIRTPEDARQKVKSGASFVVTGNVLQTGDLEKQVAAFSRAVHVKENP
jgi:putative glycerol-1-phosphate prenyltransferase